MLNCKVSGDPEASVTWTKDGLTGISRAQLKDNGKILIIKDVVLGDSGVYECKAMNVFGESRSATTLIQSLVYANTDLHVTFFCNCIMI